MNLTVRKATDLINAMSGLCLLVKEQMVIHSICL